MLFSLQKDADRTEASLNVENTLWSNTVVASGRYLFHTIEFCFVDHVVLLVDQLKLLIIDKIHSELSRLSDSSFTFLALGRNLII